MFKIQTCARKTKKKFGPNNILSILITAKLKNFNRDANQNKCTLLLELVVNTSKISTRFTAKASLTLWCLKAQFPFTYL